MNRMCIDPERYEPDEYWHSLGIGSSEQVRQELLWRAAEDSNPPQHTETCADCFALYHSFVRLRAIVVPADAAAPVAMACCPDTQRLGAYQTGEAGEEESDAIAAHLKQCAPCREDLAFLARSQEPRERLLSLRSRVVLMAVAAAALLAAIIPWQRGPGKTEQAKLNFTPSSKWANLVHMPEVNRSQMMKESPESHHSRLEQVLAAYEKADYATAEKFAGVMTSVVEDSSAEYLLAMARYKQNKVEEGYRAVLASERIAPFTAPRCWATLQYALLMGDKKTVEREAAHVGDEDGYGPKCRDILKKIG